MDFIAHLLLGVLMAYIGLIPPGMINMTVVRTTLSYGRKQAVSFAAGASVVVSIQASIAMVFANYFHSHPEVLEGLTMVGGIVLLVLSGFFYIQARKKFRGEGKEKTNGFFSAGLALSALNMLSVPFYLGWSTFLSLKGWITLQQPYILFFVLGAGIGAFLLCVSYSYFAKVVQQKAQFIASNINYILSGLFFVLGVVTLVKIAFM